MQTTEKRLVLITGAAGFIGFHLAIALLRRGHQVLGLDNLNDYYDPGLKEARLTLLKGHQGFSFTKADLADDQAIFKLFDYHRPELVINLAAQAGVRYSITNPKAYINSNVVGFFNILEACRHYKVKHLMYASSSSVYGNQQKVPFSTDDNVDHPISLYAATKKSNELMAFTYSHLYDIPSTGLRFFTVYGPFGRPDMAYFSFTQKLLEGKTIKVFNHGDMKRDFTYIDDIVTGIVHLMDKPPRGEDPARIYNIGNNQPVQLLEFINTLEVCLMAEGLIQEPAIKEFLPMQLGDVYQTYADVDPLAAEVGFRPSTSLKTGLTSFVRWYRQYYKL